jgi:hypothetical protein
MVYYYYGNGQPHSAYGPIYLVANEARELYLEIPSGLAGTAWLHSSTSDVVAAVHHSHTSGVAYGYNAVP